MAKKHEVTGDAITCPYCGNRGVTEEPGEMLPYQYETEIQCDKCKRKYTVVFSLEEIKDDEGEELWSVY
jgi:C4-type Zn-finger protein